MRRVFRLSAGLMVAAMAVFPASAGRGPDSLRLAEPGLWSIKTPGTNLPPRQVCVTDPSALARIEHFKRQCAMNTVSEGPDGTTFHYSCTGGGFGQSKIKMVTPRAMRIETQGILLGQPFHHVLHARRIGACR